MSALARSVTGLVLLAAGAHMSFAAPEEFAAVVEKYMIMPDVEWVLPFAKALPVAEMLVGASLVLGWRVRQAAAAAMALFGMFIAALASTKLRHIDLADCGCFGKGIHLRPAWTMALDSVLMGLSYFAWRRPGEHAWLDAWVERGTP